MKPLVAFGEMMRAFGDFAEHMLTHDVKADLQVAIANEQRRLLAKRESGGKRVVTSEGVER